MPKFSDSDLIELSKQMAREDQGLSKWECWDLIDDLMDARQTIAELNATIERHKVVNRKHIEQFAAITKEAREILARNRVYGGDRTLVHRIITAASARIPSEPPEEGV